MGVSSFNATTDVAARSTSEATKPDENGDKTTREQEEEEEEEENEGGLTGGARMKDKYV